MIALASDHIGLSLKRRIISYLEEKGLAYKDFGTFSTERCDYPVFAQKAAEAVVLGECKSGILFCGTGIGMSIAANKVKGIRCVVCSDVYSAVLSRQHNNTNMLSLGSRVVGEELALMIVDFWLNTPYEGGRHQHRIEQITNIEKCKRFDMKVKKITGNTVVDELIAKMTLEEKIQLVHGKKCDKYLGNQAGFVEGIKRLGIPDLFICDGESGVNISWDTTALPAKVGLAATFDTETAMQYGEILGREAKDTGMNVILTPRVNIVRDPVADIMGSNGGNYQTYGEDPILNGKMGAAEAVGIQKDNNCIANLKQMFGSSTGTAQGSPACFIPEQAMHEIYMRVFEEPVRAGVGSAMTNYNKVNNKWTYFFTEMNKNLLRDEWGFKGFIIDDWHCLFDPEAIMENVTLEMPGKDYVGEGSEKSVYGQKLIDAIKDPNNPVTEDHLDRAVGYLLDTLYRFLFYVAAELYHRQCHTVLQDPNVFGNNLSFALFRRKS
jgi:ribose 5-phosphate isomerase B